MAAGTWVLYNHTTKEIGDVAASGISLSDAGASAFKMALFTKLAQDVFDLTQTTFAGITTESENEHGTTATGYTAGGEGLASVAWATVTGDISEWTFADEVWTASTNGIDANYAAVYQVSPDLLIGYVKLDSTADSVISNQETDGATTISTGNFTSALATFQTDAVAVGDVLEITAGGAAGDRRRYEVDTISSETALVVSPNFTATNTGHTYEVKRVTTVTVTDTNTLTISDGNGANGMFRIDGSP